MSADDEENADTCDATITKINDLIDKNNNIPNPKNYPPQAITDMSKLTPGKSYKIHKVVDLQLSKIDTCGELRVTETTPETGYLKYPYYLVKKGWLFGWGGGKKSRKYRRKGPHTRRRKSRRNHRK